MLFSNVLLRLMLSVTGIVGGGILTFGKARKWRSTPSLHWLQHGIPFVTLQFWGLLVIVYGLLLLTVRTRSAGYALGAALFTVFTISLCATLPQSGPKSIMVIVMAIDVVVFHVMAIDISADARYAQDTAAS